MEPASQLSNLKNLGYLLWRTLWATGNYAEGMRRLLVHNKKWCVPLKLGRLNLLITVDPDDIRRVLIKEADQFHKVEAENRTLRPVLEGGLILAEGKEWSDRREAMAPCFGPDWMPFLIRVASEASTDRTKKWNGVVNVTHEMRCIISDATARFFMNGEPLGTGPGEDDLDSYSRYSAEIEDGLEARAADILKLGERWQRHFGPPQRYQNALGSVAKMIRGRVERARENPGQKKTPLSILMESLSSTETVCAELSTLGAAGATSVHHLSWTCQLLASHPEVQQKLHQEITEKLRRCKSAAEIPLAELDDTPYLSAVTQESMRLFPPAPLMYRTDPKQNVHFVFPIWAMQRHPDFWDAPDAFQPQRWLGAEKAPPAYMPFGAGPRFCIARRFSIIESKVVLMEILSRFWIERSDRRPPVAKVYAMTRPKKDIHLLLRPISGN
jgi:cytochrome P450